MLDVLEALAYNFIAMNVEDDIHQKEYDESDCLNPWRNCSPPDILSTPVPKRCRNGYMALNPRTCMRADSNRCRALLATVHPRNCQIRFV
jgi:hypothetical protein